MTVLVEGSNSFFLGTQAILVLDKNELKAAGFKVYPNPAQSTSAIFIEQEHASAGEVEVMLWSLVGQPVYRKMYKSAPASGIQATFQSVPAGVYMIELVKDGKSLGKKPLVLKD